jgi:hypothetical protein
MNSVYSGQPLTSASHSAGRYSGEPEQLLHDARCIRNAGGIYAAKCDCGEYVRNPDLWRTIYPKPYVATLECIGQHRAFTPYVAQLPTRHVPRVSCVPVRGS